MTKRNKSTKTETQPQVEENQMDNQNPEEFAEAVVALVEDEQPEETPVKKEFNPTREEVEANAAKYASRSEWNRKGRKFHAFAREQEWLDDIYPRKSTAIVYTRELCEELVAKCEGDRSLFGRAYTKAHNFAREGGFLDEIAPKKIIAKKAQPEAEPAAEVAEVAEGEGA